MRSLSLWLGALALAVSPSCGKPEKPMFFVAASLADVAAAWQAASGVGFDYHTGASHLLAQQIREGAGADLFLAAGAAALTPLWTEGRVFEVDSNYLRNRLVLVTAAGLAPPGELSQLREPRFARIAMADPDLAPAGDYARAGLKQAGLWDELRPRFLFTGDVRMAAETVRLATADVAFVYATDASSVKLAATALDSAWFPDVSYPLARLAPRTPSADSLWAFLHTPAARALATAQGFR